LELEESGVWRSVTNRVMSVAREPTVEVGTGAMAREWLPARSVGKAIGVKAIDGTDPADQVK
jgi:hypothetical protein